jgi:hypothetical protein
MSCFPSNASTLEETQEREGPLSALQKFDWPHLETARHF